MKHIATLILISATILLLYGCASATPEPTPARQPSRTPTIIPATATPSPSATLTPTATLYPTITSTRTPLPVEEVDAWVNEMMETNGGCELPCWWGITPGQTTWEETLSIIQDYPDPGSELFPIDEELFHTILYFHVLNDDPSYPYPTRNLQIDVYVQDSTVSMISILDISEIPEYLLPMVLASFGQPDDIRLISLIQSEFEQQIRTEIQLFYYELGVSFGYSSWGENIADITNVCFNIGPQINTNYDYPFIWLWDPDQELSYVDIEFARNFDEFLQGSGLTIDDFHPFPLEELTGISPEEFTQRYSNNDVPICLEMSSEYWYWWRLIPTQTPRP